MNLGGDLGQIYHLLFQELKNVLVRPIYGLLKIAILALSWFTPKMVNFGISPKSPPYWVLGFI